MTTAQVNNQNHLQLDHFAKDVQEIIVQAQTLADELRHAQIQPLHLFASALKHESVLKAFKAINHSEKEMVSMVNSALTDITPNRKEEESYFSRTCESFFAGLEKDSSASDLVHLDKFFSTLVSKSYKPNCAIFLACGVKLEDFTAQLAAMRKSGFGQKSNAELLKMEEEIGKRVIGQKDAVHAISRVVRRGKVGLNDAGKPIGSMLFLGSSGVGKTEVAKALTQFLYEDERKLIRLDMSEFSEKHQVARLIGSPPGYHGSDDGGQLTNAVRENPYAIVLLDEIEKAHSDVYDLFLSILDDSRLTDGKGRTTDFSNTIIIMTSNIGSRRIVDFSSENVQNDDGKAALKEMLHGELTKFLKPEMINRIDDIIIFTPLSKMETDQIVSIQLNSLTKILRQKEMTISFDQLARDAICLMGYDPLYGARPLKRVILRRIKDPLCEKILAGEYGAGSLINISYDGERFLFN